MKVWEKITQFNDTKGWDKKAIASECYMYKYCPIDIEENNHFISEEQLDSICGKSECDIKCLEKYLDLEVKED